MIYKTFLIKMKNKLEEEKNKHNIEDYAFWPDGYTDPEHVEEIEALNLKNAGIHSSVLHGDRFNIRFRNFSHAISAEEYFDYANMYGWKYLDSAISREIRYANSSHKPVSDTDPFAMAKLNEDLIVRAIQIPEEGLDEDVYIYQRYGDIALCLYILVGDNGYDYLTLKLPRHIASQMNLTDEYLTERALLNTAVLYPPVLYDNPADAYYCENGLTFEKAEYHNSFPDGFFLSNTRTVNGATALFYPGVMEKTAQLFNDDFYVVCIAVSLVHLIPANNVDPAALQKALDGVNTCGFDGTLSSHIFRYCRDSRKLFLYQ